MLNYKVADQINLIQCFSIKNKSHEIWQSFIWKKNASSVSYHKYIEPRVINIQFKYMKRSFVRISHPDRTTVTGSCWIYYNQAVSTLHIMNASVYWTNWKMSNNLFKSSSSNNIVINIIVRIITVNAMYEAERWNSVEETHTICVFIWYTLLWYGLHERYAFVLTQMWVILKTLAVHERISKTSITIRPDKKQSRQT